MEKDDAEDAGVRDEEGVVVEEALVKVLENAVDNASSSSPTKSIITLGSLCNIDASTIPRSS